MAPTVQESVVGSAASPLDPTYLVGRAGRLDARSAGADDVSRKTHGTSRTTQSAASECERCGPRMDRIIEPRSGSIPAPSAIGSGE
jgi:hypothetical protein